MYVRRHDMPSSNTRMFIVHYLHTHVTCTSHSTKLCMLYVYVFFVDMVCVLLRKGATRATALRFSAMPAGEAVTVVT